MKRRGCGRWARLGGGAAILAVVVWRLGTGPIVAGIRSISVWPLVIAAAIAAATTVAAAWRWTVIARQLDVPIDLKVAVAAYYRSQFLNTALPGGVLGDVERGVTHGREAGDLGRGLRAVAWDRFAGQAVQLALAFVVLLVFASPVRAAMPLVAAVTAVSVVALVVVLRRVPGRWPRTLSAELRDGLLSRRAWPAVTGASVVVVAGHTATFLIAARVAGSDATVVTLLPLAMLVMLAMVVPLSIGGWGPREGAAAWVFAAAGLGASRGVAAATVYGVMVLVSSLPGAAVMVMGRRARLAAPAERHVPEQPRRPVTAAGRPGD